MHVARENVCEWAMIDFGFTSGHLRKWHEFSKPITSIIMQNQGNV